MSRNCRLATTIPHLRLDPDPPWGIEVARRGEGGMGGAVGAALGSSYRPERATARALPCPAPWRTAPPAVAAAAAAAAAAVAPAVAVAPAPTPGPASATVSEA
jgi:hypothetical protein